MPVEVLANRTECHAWRFLDRLVNRAVHENSVDAEGKLQIRDRFEIARTKHPRNWTNNCERFGRCQILTVKMGYRGNAPIISYESRLWSLVQEGRKRIRTNGKCRHQMLAVYFLLPLRIA